MIVTGDKQAVDAMLHEPRGARIAAAMARAVFSSDELIAYELGEVSYHPAVEARLDKLIRRRNEDDV